MTIPELDDFLLVGGTNLSLHYGHRISNDLDLFSIKNFDNAEISVCLVNHFENFSYRSLNNPIGLFGFIGDLKIDLVKHQFALIDQVEVIDGIRMISIPDIIAMKVNAIMKRAVKKDFWDICELLNHYSIPDIIQCYEKKFPSQQLLISVPHALIYFDDAEESEDPISLKGQTWEAVKKSIQKHVREFLK